MDESAELKRHSLFPSIFLRGVLMGAADIVPGVSGGTMAFITGIYHRLLAAISAVDVTFIKLVWQLQWKRAWSHVDAAFLLTLGAGIALSVFSLARVIGYLLATYPLLVWSFFFGLILGSALILMRNVGRWSVGAVLSLIAGVAIAVTIALLPALAMPESYLSYFFAGFVAICAMILPGISGSFILVLLGMYTRVLAAIESFDIAVILIFASGAGCGLLVFSRLLSYLLERFHALALALLTGFLLGSLVAVWPWKLLIETQSQPVMPSVYAAAQGDPQLALAVTLMIAGWALVWLFEVRWGGLER